MKKTIFSVMLIFIICSAFNKTKIIMPVDYRDAYIGSYFCKKSTTKINSDGPYLIKDTITIQISKDVLDSVLQIAIRSNVSKFKLRNGVLIEYPREGHSNGKFFTSDSIALLISYGHGYQSRLLGKKL